MTLSQIVRNLFRKRYGKYDELSSIRAKLDASIEETKLRKNLAEIRGNNVSGIVDDYSDARKWYLTDRLESVKHNIQNEDLNYDELTVIKDLNKRLLDDYTRRICKLTKLEYEEIKSNPTALSELLKTKLNTRYRRNVMEKYDEINQYIMDEIERKEQSITKLMEDRSRSNFMRLVAPLAIAASVLLFTHSENPDKYEPKNELRSEYVEDTLPPKTDFVRVMDKPIIATTRPADRPIISERRDATLMPQGIDVFPDNSKYPLTVARINAGKLQESTEPREYEITRLEIPDVSPVPEITRSLSSIVILPNTLSIIRGNPNYKNIALTFDGGSTNEAADSILDILEKYGIKSTFFLTGRFIENYPDIVRKMVADGHEIGNHTYSHPHMNQLSDDQFRMQIIRTQEAYKDLTGKDMAPYWRAPYGEYIKKQARIVRKELGLLHTFWTHGRTRGESLDTLDWVEDQDSPIYHSASTIADHILNSSYKDGGIALFHLGARKIDPVYKKLPYIIEGLQRQGYRIVTVTQLVEDMRPRKIASLKN